MGAGGGDWGRNMVMIRERGTLGPCHIMKSWAHGARKLDLRLKYPPSKLSRYHCHSLISRPVMSGRVASLGPSPLKVIRSQVIWCNTCGVRF